MLDTMAKTDEGQVVTEVAHWTNRLFLLRTARPPSLRFRFSEVIMIGLPGPKGKPVLRAYSIASPEWDGELELFSTKVPDGPLASMLQRIEPGDSVFLKGKPTGTLVLVALIPGKRLYMFATGTGIARFASLVRDPETYEKLVEVVLTHTCSEVAELAYGEELIRTLSDDPLVGDEAAAKMKLYATVKREDNQRRGRITERLQDGRLFADLGVPPIERRVDRAMICGSMGLNNQLKAQLEVFGLNEGSNNRPAEYVLEKSLVG